MGARYQLDVLNESTESTDLCLYQRNPEGGYPAMPVAWLVEHSNPSSRTTFEWTADYSFVWGEVSDVRPGAVFRSAESMSADPGDGRANSARFDGRRLSRDRDPGQVGSLVIRVDAGVPSRGVAAGIGMADRAFTVAGAQPMWTLMFQPRQEYWLAAGSFEAGEVLHPDGAPNAVRIAFQAGGTKMTARYGADRRWTVQPG